MVDDVNNGNEGDTAPRRQYDRQERGSDAPISGRCGAKIPRTNPPRYCTMFPARDRARCRFHGGASPRGPRSGGWRNGRYSQAMPERLLERYERAEADPELLSTRAEAALLEAHLAELIGKLDRGGSSWDWAQVTGAFAALDAAIRAMEPPAILAAMAAMKAVIEAGQAEAALWAEIRRVIREKTRVASAEWKRLVDLRQLLTVDRATAMGMALIDIVLRHVTDLNARASIASEMAEVLNRAPAQLSSGPADLMGPDARIVEAE
jgi:hypothetical protein